MVEIESGDNSVTLRECQVESGVNDGTEFRDCVYTCQCEGTCPRVYLQFHSLQAIGINNLDWTLCNIQMCVPFVWTALFAELKSANQGIVSYTSMVYTK